MGNTLHSRKNRGTTIRNGFSRGKDVDSMALEGVERFFQKNAIDNADEGVVLRREIPEILGSEENRRKKRSIIAKRGTGRIQ